MNKNNVLHLLLIGIVIGFLCLLGFGGKIYFELTGWPGEREATRKQLEAYLQKRFAQKMAIGEGVIPMESSGGGFLYMVHPEGSNYWIRVQQEGRGSPDFRDDYYATVWDIEAEAKIEAFLQSAYPVETEINAILESADFSQLPQWGITKAPSLLDLQAHVSNYSLAIWVTPDFDQAHPDREYETMYRVLQFLKESDLVPGAMDYYFGYTDSNSKNEDKNYIWYYFSREDFQAITSVQTMIAVLERRDNGSPKRKVFH